jgi:hypothetical protein
MPWPDNCPVQPCQRSVLLPGTIPASAEPEVAERPDLPDEEAPPGELMEFVHAVTASVNASSAAVARRLGVVRMLSILHDARTTQDVATLARHDFRQSLLLSARTMTSISCI